MNDEGIGGGTKALMIIFALFVDLFQVILALIPLADFLIVPIMSIGIFVIFFLWFKANDINVVTGTRWWATISMLVIKVTPLANLLPGWTGWVIYILAAAKRSPDTV